MIPRNRVRGIEKDGTRPVVIVWWDLERNRHGVELALLSGERKRRSRSMNRIVLGVVLCAAVKEMSVALYFAGVDLTRKTRIVLFLGSLCLKKDQRGEKKIKIRAYITRASGS